MRRRWVLVGVVVAIAVAALLTLRGCPEERDDGAESADRVRDAATGPRSTENSRRARPVERREQSPAESEPTDEPTPEEVAVPASRLVVVVLRGTDDAPVAGARVLVEGDDSPAALTGADGRAVLPRRIAGFVAVTVERPPGGAEFARRTRQIAQAPGETTVRLPGAVLLRGRVHAGGVLPSQVGLQCERSDVPPGKDRKYRELPLNPDGSFSEEVDPGRYHVWTDSAGREGSRWHHVSRDDVDPSREDVVFELREADGFTCTLVPEGISGEGLLGCASASPSGGPIAFQDTPERRAFGSPLYTLRVEAGVPHDVWAKVAKGRFDPAVAWGVARAVTPGSRVEIVVRPSWTLRVTVEDAEGRRVREPLSCLAWPERTEWERITTFGHAGPTSADGEAIIRGLPPLPATLHVGGPGEPWCSVAPVRVEPGTESVVVTVAKTERLVGYLIDAEGRPVLADVAATVPWPTPRSYDVEAGSEQPSGRFELRGLPPGPVELRWSVGGVDGGELGEVVVPAPGPVRLVARLPR